MSWDPQAGRPPGERGAPGFAADGEEPWPDTGPSGDPFDEPDWRSAETAGTGAPRPRAVPDLSPLIVLLDAVRAAIPRELQAGFTAILREVLLAARALIDRYLDRMDGREARTRVEDIPIE